jgi:hypothetical protein
MQFKFSKPRVTPENISDYNLKKVLVEVLTESRKLDIEIEKLPQKIDTRVLGLPEGFKVNFSEEFYEEYKAETNAIRVLQEARQLSNIVNFIEQQTKLVSMTAGHLSIDPAFDKIFEPTPNLLEVQHLVLTMLRTYMVRN